MSITARDLAEQLGADVVGDGDVVLSGVAKIEEASPGEVSFVANPQYRKFLDTTQASAVIVKEAPEGGSLTYLVAEDPYRAFLQTLRYFHPEAPKPEPGVHPTASVAEGVKLGDNVVIGPNCVIEEGVEIGEGTVLRALCFVGRDTKIGSNCYFHSRVTIREGCVIGERVILQDGCVVGSDGFGFAPGEEGYLKIPQVGNVILEDDVEIGANTTIDRATLGRTVVRRGAKIDNLVQLAHNVEVGSDTVIAAQTGVAGSSRVGAKSMLGGQVGISGHIKLSDQIMIAAQSGVTKDPGPGKIIAGYPAREIAHWRRTEAVISKLPELVKRVRTLEKGEGGEGNS